MSTKQDTALTNIIAALDAHQRAKRAKPEDNPMNDRDLKDLVRSAGILKSGDKYPVKTMAPESESGFLMEVERNAALKEEKNEKVNQRRARQRRAAERKLAFDKIADAPVKPDEKRMQDAWYVVHPLVPIITKIALSKQRWAARFLGSLTDDVPQIAMEKIALVLAKGDKDLQALRIASEQLGEITKKSNMIPGDQLEEDERKQRKIEKKNRKWLMGLVNNRVMGAIVDLYTEEQNLRWDNIDLIATTMANINGVGEDPMIARFKADRAPAFIASRFQKPDGIDQNLLAVAISGAITAQGLDPIAEILLNEDHRRVDGAIKWASCAEALFLATPNGEGQWMWDAVCQATKHLKRPKHARANAARIHVRNLFEWLPFLITNVVSSFDQHMIGWSQEGHRAVMASDFELFYLGDPEEKREIFQPVLKYSSVEEAARILAETMGEVFTNEDLLAEMVN